MPEEKFNVNEEFETERNEAVHEDNSLAPFGKGETERSEPKGEFAVGERSEHDEYEEEGVPFFPNHLLKEVIAVFIILAILLTLAIFLPFKLHDKANPLVTPEGIKPEWYFLWVYQALKYFPPNMLFITGKAVGVILIFIVIVFLQFIWPILDNAPERHPKRRRLSIAIVGGFFGFAIILTALSIVSEKTVTIDGARYHFDLKGIPHKVTAEEQLKIVPEATGAPLPFMPACRASASGVGSAPLLA